MTNSAQSTNFRDRKTGLIIFGILQIILGAICALLVPLMILGAIISTVAENSAAPTITAGTIAPGVLFYTLFAAWFICMGIGSIKARRWTRTLLLVSSWIWLVCGVSGLFFMLLLMPDMYDQMAESGQMPRGMVRVVKYTVAAFMAVFYVLIPGALVLFYGSRDVKRTCEFRDPQVPWTDKCPPSVLAASIMFGCWAISMPLIGFYGWVVPFFGFILSGITGAGVALAAMLLFAYVAWGTYKLRIEAWWASVFLTVVWFLSAGITFSQVSMLEFYKKMNFSEQQLTMMEQYSMPQGPVMVLFVGFWLVGFLGFLLYTKRHFNNFAEHPDCVI